MASSSVSLGGITFQGHEVPEKIPFGGKQTLAKHRLVGGRRVTDAMGPDDCEPRWEGRFRGENALGRAQAVDAMRKAGAQVPLTWGGLYYLVVIEEFEADYRRSTDISYKITCYVVDDGTAAGDIVSSLNDIISGDLGAVIDLAVGIASNPIGTAIDALSDAIGAVDSLVTAPTISVGPIQVASAAALGAVDAALADADANLVAVGTPDLSLLAGPAFADVLFGTADALDAMDGLLRVRGLVGRIDANLSTLSG